MARPELAVKSKQLVAVVSPEIDRGLRELARRERRSVSAMIAVLIEDALDRHQSEDAESPGREAVSA